MCVREREKRFPLQSCMLGAVSKAEQAKSFAMEADQKLNEKQKEAEQVK